MHNRPPHNFKATFKFILLMVHCEHRRTLETFHFRFGLCDLGACVVRGLSRVIVRRSSSTHQVKIYICHCQNGDTISLRI